MILDDSHHSVLYGVELGWGINDVFMKYTFVILVLATITLGHPATAQLRSGDDIVIDEPVDHDLYVAGGSVTLNAPVKGDLIVAGGTVVVNDTVAQDILAAGGDLLLLGFVADDIRCAGGTIQLGSSVSGDVVAAGGRIQILKDAVISGNLLSTGGDVTLDGRVKGDVQAASGTFTLNGTAEGELECKGGKILVNGDVAGRAVLAAEEIEIGSHATFGKGVRYWNERGSLDFGNSMRNGEATYDPSLEIEDGKWHYLGFASFIMLLWYLLTAFVMMLLIQYLFSATLRNSANNVVNSSLKALGVGFLFLVGVPIVIIILFVTIIGIPVGILTFVVYLTIILFATSIVALLIANWVNTTYYRAAWGNGRVVFSALGIFIVLKIGSLTPFIGPLVMLLLACTAFGGILLSISWRKKKLAFT